MHQVPLEEILYSNKTHKKPIYVFKSENKQFEKMVRFSDSCIKGLMNVNFT